MFIILNIFCYSKQAKHLKLREHNKVEEKNQFYSLLMGLVNCIPNESGTEKTELKLVFHRDIFH